MTRSLVTWSRVRYFKWRDLCLVSCRHARYALMDEQWNGCLASTEAATIYISRSFLQPRMLEPVSGAGNFSPVVMPVCLVCVGSEEPHASFGPTSHKNLHVNTILSWKRGHITGSSGCVERLNTKHPFKLQESLISFPDTDVPGRIHSLCEAYKHFFK